MRRILASLLVAGLILGLSVSSLGAADYGLLTLEQFRDEVAKNSRSILNMEVQINQLDAKSSLDYNNYLKAQYGGQKAPGISLSSTLSSISSAKETWESTKKSLADTQRAREDLLKKIAYMAEKQYIDAVNLQRAIQIKEKKYQQMLRQLNALRLQENLGMVTDEAVAQTEVVVANLGMEIQYDKDKLKAKIKEMNDMMGWDLNTGFKLLDFEVANPKAVTAVVAHVTEECLKNAANLSQLQRDLQDMQDDLVDMVHKDRNDRDSNKEKIQEAIIESQKIKIADAEQAVRNAVELLVAGLRSSIEAYNNAEISYITAEKTYNWNKVKYELGLISLIEYEKAETVYLDALNAKTNSAYNYFVANHAVELAKKGILIN